MRKTNIILLGSLSKGKIKEFQALFNSYPEIEFKSLYEMAWNPSSFGEVENGKTYYDNAFAKCKLAHLASKVPTISDDSGLEVEFLKGAPGVFSHRYATSDEVLLSPLKNQDSANTQKLLKAIKGDNRRARFVCTIVFMVEGVVLAANGIMDGTIAESPRGTLGFGYDPVFLPNGSDKTLAEMDLAEKNKISHRAKALSNLMNILKEKKIELVRP